MSDDKPDTPKKPARKPAKKPAAQKPDAHNSEAGTGTHPVTKPIPVVQGKPAEAPPSETAPDAAKNQPAATQPTATQPTEVLAPAAASATQPAATATTESVATAEPEVVVVPAPKRKRRRWPWILGGILLILAVLGTIAFFVGDAYAKNYARDYIKQRIVAVLGIEDPSQVKVDVGDGSILLQALAGRLNEVDIDAGTVTFGTLTGVATVHAEGVPLKAEAETRKLDVTFAVAEDDVVSALSGNLSGVKLDSVALEEPEIVATTSFSFFGFQIPVGMGIVPSADEGQIVFTPTSIKLGDDTYTADELKQTFGGFASQLLQQQSVCVNENLPKALTIVDVDVVKKDLVIQINGDGVALGGTDLSTPGTCAK